MYYLVWSRFSRWQITAMYVAFLTAIALSILQLQGCTQLGISAPANVEQGIAYIYPANALVREEAAKLLKIGSIKKQEAVVVLDLTDKVRSAADIARDYVRAGDQTAAQRNLTLARNVLKEARTFLGMPDDKELK